MTKPQPTSYQWAKTISISLKIKNKIVISTFIIHIQHITGRPNHSNQTEEEIKCTQVGKEVILSLFANDMILHRENPEDSTKNY